MIRPNLNSTDVTSMRSYAAQRLMISQHDQLGIESFVNYTRLLGERFYDVVTPFLKLKPRYKIELGHREYLKQLHQANISNDNETHSEFQFDNFQNIVYPPVVVRSQPNSKTEDLILEYLMNEAQGGVRIQPKLSDLLLSATDLSKVFSASLHFKLGIRLSKLCLYDLGQKHISIAATPWEPVHYSLRYALSLPPVYPSIRSLAQLVDNFESKIEKYLLYPHTMKSSVVNVICESFDQTGIVLGVLPLLHLTGYNAPRQEVLMGYSPIPMPVLLSEFYSTMCATYSPASHFHILPPPTQLTLGATMERNIFTDDEPKAPPVMLQYRTKPFQKIRIGIISGSFDSLSGRIVIGTTIWRHHIIFIGMLEAMDPSDRSKYELIAMCFPTPRDMITDRAKGVFHGHVNLFSSNRYAFHHLDLDITL